MYANQRDPAKWKSEEEYLAECRRFWTRCVYDPLTERQGATDTALSRSDRERVEAVDRIIADRERLYGWQEEMQLRTFGGLDVLDFGCGTGVDSVTMAKHGAKVTLCDIVPSNVEYAVGQMKARGFKVETFTVDRYSDIEKLGMFDVVYAGGVLMNIPPLWLKGVVDRLKRRLRRPNGKFVAMTYVNNPNSQPGPEGPYTKPGFSFAELEMLFGADMKITHHHMFNAGTFQATVAVFK